MLNGSAVLVDATAWVLAQVATLPDTVVTIAAPIQPGWFERTTQILDALLTFSFIALAAAVIPAAWNFRKSYKKINDLLDRVYADVNPIAHHASRIAENVDYMTTAVRADVQRASALVTDAERRLQVAITSAETRARALEALLDVAQDEAEQSFVSAAATVRGVRASVSQLGDVLEASLTPALRRRGARPVREDAYAADVPDELALVDVRGHGARPQPAVVDDDLNDDLLADDLEDELDEDLTLYDLNPDHTDDPSLAPQLDQPERPRVRPRRGPRHGG